MIVGNKKQGGENGRIVTVAKLGSRRCPFILLQMKTVMTMIVMVMTAIMMIIDVFVIVLRKQMFSFRDTSADAVFVAFSIVAILIVRLPLLH